MTDQEIKTVVMARKNFLFADTEAGARALCIHLSLLRSAKLHGQDPYRYFVHILLEVPHCVVEPIRQALEQLGDLVLLACVVALR